MNILELKAKTNSNPVPGLSSGLSGNALISWTTPTLAQLQASVPRLIDDAEQIVLVLFGTITVESLLLLKGFGFDMS